MLRPAGPFSVAGLEWLSAFDLFRYAMRGGGVVINVSFSLFFNTGTLYCR